uniref:Nephrocystin 3-like N-terminal domain-containing protein n=1 Tax=Bionectria ochroleuca TaxID=29856 RepID=A0A8H7K2J4_BIOOC
MSDSEDYSEPDTIIIDDDDVSNYNPDNILPKSPEEIRSIRKWLEPTQYAISGGEFRKHLASHAQGTGQWLTSTEEYEQWLQGEECGLLWMKGIPGSGKSVYVAKLIDDLGKTNPSCPVLFFFFRQIIAANHSPQALVRDWMDQILKYSPPLQHQLLMYVNNEVSLSSLSTSDLLKDLQMAFRALPDKVFCIADALDEMDTGNDAFIQAIGSLGQWRPAKVKVLITSRPVPRVEAPYTTHRPSISGSRSDSLMLTYRPTCIPFCQNHIFLGVNGVSL